MRVAVIPARGGSKRIPRKNIKEFAGLPMIVHSLIAAKLAGIFDRILVSSDDDEILAVGVQYGGESLCRPSELADDFAGTMPVVRHAIRQLQAEGCTLSEVCCIYATAPFVTAADIRRGWEILVRTKMSFAFSAATFAYPVFRALLHADSGVRMIFPEHFSSRSQDLPETIHDAGQFYWGTTGAWLEEQVLFSDRSAPIMLPRHRVQDIDTMDDWRRAEVLWQVLQAEAKKGNIDGG